MHGGEIVISVLAYNINVPVANATRTQVDTGNKSGADHVVNRRRHSECTHVPCVVCTTLSVVSNL